MVDKVYQDRDWLYRYYWEKGLNTDKMGALAGVCNETIRRWMHRLNVPFRDGTWRRLHYREIRTEFLAEVNDG